MNPIACYDFTIPQGTLDYKFLITRLSSFCKKFVFQLEKGKSGYVHYQGRVSLKVKVRLNTLIKKSYLAPATHWSITSNNCKGNFNYVMKEETRLEGPWRDCDVPVYIPRQFRNKLDCLRPFQQYIWDTRNIFDDRIINIIYCPKGNIGKSVIASLCELQGGGVDLPICNDSEKLVSSLCNICSSKELRNPSPIFIDIPRSFNQEKLYGMFCAIELIKKGKLYDMRYNYKTWWIDSPQIWVFMNVLPKHEYLSNDRWRLWEVNDNYELIVHLQLGDS